MDGVNQRKQEKKQELKKTRKNRRKERGEKRNGWGKLKQEKKNRNRKN